MATTLSSSPDFSLLQTPIQVDSNYSFLFAKRSFSESYDSSYGESGATPTSSPSKKPRLFSYPAYDADLGSPATLSTPQLALRTRHLRMEESGEESDEVYDEFDLGDFTIDEIKAYESMVGPGERLRDAVPPKKSLAEILEASYKEALASSDKHTTIRHPVSELPKELYELVRAGILNAIERAISENVITEHERTAESLKEILMDEISAPTPQISQFIREHDFAQASPAPIKYRSQAQREFEQDLYHFSRNLGVSISCAEKWVLKAREIWIKNYESTEGSRLLTDTYTSEGSLDESSGISSPESFESSLIPIKQSCTKAVVQKPQEKAARKAAKKERRKSGRQVEKFENRKDENGLMVHSKGSLDLTSDSEESSQSDQLEDKNNSQRPGKRDSDRVILLQSEAQFRGHPKHEKRKVHSGAQNADSKKAKRKNMAAQQSPFFQRNSGGKEKKKDAGEKAKDFRPPMIQPSFAGLPSTPSKRIPVAFSTPLSDDSSPLSSLRSTPSLPSFDSEDVRRDNERIRQLSYSCTISKPVASTPCRSDDPIGLLTPISSPISLRELNKRLLEGSIYQDRPVLAVLEAPAKPATLKKTRKRSVTVSRFFAKSVCKKPKASDKISCIPFPPLHSTSFGLVQERLSHDPFRLLIAVIFLNKTRGSVALPVFYQLMERYPTPADLAAAKQEDVVGIIQHLGLQNQRAKKCINLAKAWLKRPPEKGKRYRVLHYPKRYDGKDVRPDEIVGEEDQRIAWEIGQLPGIGVYAIDSWRIFCRDELRGLPTGLPKELTPEAQGEDIQKEWTRVLAGDKELRAYLRWRWLRNGWNWDPVTGKRKKAEESELARADKGGVIYEGDEGDMVLGGVKGEGLEAVKAESEAKVEDVVKEVGKGADDNDDKDDVITDTKVAEMLNEKRKEEKPMTAEPQLRDDMSGEQADAEAKMSRLQDGSEHQNKPELE